MGQTLSFPVTNKASKSGGNERFSYAVTEMQGWRSTMEDSHAVALDLEDGEDTAFFAVYDGHGGVQVAQFAGDNVHKRLVKEDTYREKKYETAMKRAFLGTDEDLLADPRRIWEPSGCTAVAALVTDRTIYVANAGDSRSVMSVKGVVKPLSFDHKPSNEAERNRIAKAGGFVEYGRVNGNLAMSRALGDFGFKKNYSLTPEHQIVTAEPEVTQHEISPDDEFIVLACDGIWDCLSSQEVVNFVRRKVWERKPLSEIGEMLCDHCLAPDTISGLGVGCDNMTVLVVALLQGRTLEEWYEWIRDRVEKNYGYETPLEPRQLYSQSRLMSFKAEQEAERERRLEQERGPGDTSSSDECDDDSDMEVDSLGSGRSIFGHALGARKRKHLQGPARRLDLEDEDGDLFMRDDENKVSIVTSVVIEETQSLHSSSVSFATATYVNGDIKPEHEDDPPTARTDGPSDSS